MFNMRVSDAIYTLVEAIFPQPRGTGLLVTLDLRLEHPKDKRRHTSGNVSFVFERPHNYCKVWTGVTYTGFDVPELAEWEMVSDHDSCWRDAVNSAIVKEYFSQAKRISKQMAPKRMEEWCHIHNVERVKLAYEPIDPSNQYKKRLTLLERAK